MVKMFGAKSVHEIDSRSLHYTLWVVVRLSWSTRFPSVKRRVSEESSPTRRGNWSTRQMVWGWRCMLLFVLVHLNPSYPPKLVTNFTVGVSDSSWSEFPIITPSSR